MHIPNTQTHSPSLPPSLLGLGGGKVPGGVLGTLAHGSHQPSEAHVLGLLQATHQTLLHDGDELLVTQLPVTWETRTRGGRGADGG